MSSSSSPKPPAATDGWNDAMKKQYRERLGHSRNQQRLRQAQTTTTRHRVSAVSPLDIPATIVEITNLDSRVAAAEAEIAAIKKQMARLEEAQEGTNQNLRDAAQCLGGDAIGSSDEEAEAEDIGSEDSSESEEEEEPRKRTKRVSED